MIELSIISQYTTTTPLVAGNEAPSSNDLLDEQLRCNFETHCHDSGQRNPFYNTILFQEIN